MSFNQLIQQIEESLGTSQKESMKIIPGQEFSRAVFPEGEISFREKKINGRDYLEMHIQIKKKYQGMGHASERIKQLIKQLNKPAYFSHGRILNDNMYKVFDKIKSDNDFVVIEDERGTWIEFRS